MVGINIDDLTIEQYLRLTSENQTPSMVKKVDDMTINEYIEYEERMKRQYSRSSGSYFPTYSSHNTTIECPSIANFNAIQSNIKFNYDSKDMELDEEAGYKTNEESVTSEHEALDPTQANDARSLDEELSSEEDLDEWDVLKNKRKSAPEVDLKNSSKDMEDSCNDDNFTSNFPNQSPLAELNPGGFLLPFTIGNYNSYVMANIDASNNVMPRSICEYLMLDNLEGASIYYEWVTQNYEFDNNKTPSTTTVSDKYPYKTNYPTPVPIDEWDTRCHITHTGDTFNQNIPNNDPTPLSLEHSELGDKANISESLKIQPFRPRPCDYSFDEWLKVKIGHTNIYNSDRETVFNEWILNSFDVEEEYDTEIRNPYSRRFDEYKRVFDNEVEIFSNEYTLRVAKKGGQSFICITKQDDDALPLGRVNGARFKAMIRKKLMDKGVPAARKQFSRPSRSKPSQDVTRPLGPPSSLKGLLHMLNATVIPTKGILSLLKMDLSTYYISYDQKQSSREFLVLILLFSIYFISLMYNKGIVKYKYVTRNTGKGRKNEENADSYDGLRRNIDDNVTLHPSQRYDVTWLISYAVPYFMPTTWKASSALYGVHSTRYPFDYHVSLGFGSIAGSLDPVSPVIRLPIERRINSGTRRGAMKSEADFEIKSQFMRELKEETFSKNKNEDANDHVDRVLNIVSLFNIPGVLQDAVLLHVSPFTLIGTAKRWVDRLTPGAFNTWDLFKKAFIQRYCPPSKNAKRLEDIHNFKQEIDESLYQAWERFNDLLYKCPTHDINSHQKDVKSAKYLTSTKNVLSKRKSNRRRRPNMGNLAAQLRSTEVMKAKYLVGPPGYYTRTDNRPPYGEKRPSLEEL
ncbi:BYPASS-related protein [Tanacetum coccineum]